MKCPICDVDLVLSDKMGVEIDYCPKCRGIWLDRGELEKIIERTYSQSSTSMPAYGNNYKEDGYRHKSDDHHDYDDDDHHRKEGQYYGNNRKKKGFLGDLFDF